jgi:hypothetical protein
MVNMRKNKKISFGIIIVLIFLLFSVKNAKAEEGACMPTGAEYCYVNCSQYTTPAECEAQSGCCFWAPAGALATSTGCEICGGYGMNWLGWLECLTIYFLTFPLRLVPFLIAVIGYGVGYLMLYAGMGLVPGVVSEIIAHSLTFNYGQLPNLQQGWNAVKDLSLGFVYIFLLIIGLATILKLFEYEAKKAFVPLLVAAVLIHFSFAISTTLIHWGNDLTKWVKGELEKGFGVTTTGGDFLNASSTFWGLQNVLSNSFLPTVNTILCESRGDWSVWFQDKEIKSDETVIVRGPLITKFLLITMLPWLIASIIFFILSCYISIGIVFLMRTVFLIGLIIISPIAFLTAAFRTKEMQKIFPGFLNWEGWFHTFLEWVFTGLNLVIWVTVAALIIKAGGGLFLTNPVGQGISVTSSDAIIKGSIKEAMTALTGPLVDVIKYLIPTLAAALPLFVISITSPALARAFADATLGFFRQVSSALMMGGAVAFGAGIGAAAGVIKGAMAAQKGIGGKLTAAVSSLPRAGSVFFKELTVGTTKEALLAPLPEKMRKKVGEAFMESWARRASPEKIEKRIGDIEQQKGPVGVQEIVESPFSSELERRIAMKKAMEGGYFKDEWFKDEKLKNSLLKLLEDVASKKDKKTVGIIERGSIRSLAENPELEKEFKGIVTKHGMYDETKEGAYINRIVRGIRSADDVKQLQSGAISKENVKIMKAMMEELTGHQWGLIGKEIGRKLGDALEPTIEEIKSLSKLTEDELQKTYGTRDRVEVYKNIVWSMPGLARYSQTSAAQELGIPSFFEIAPGAVKEKYKNINEILAEKPPTPPSKIPTEEAKRRKREAERVAREEEEEIRKRGERGG